MITDKHYISLYINDSLAELKSSGSLGIRLNDVLFKPEQTKTTQATYSFTFGLPSTPNNDKIFANANNIDKLNKFNARYDAKLYADEVLVFEGSIIVKGYNHNTKEYQCNLVSKKIYSLDEIFGEMKLTDIEWEEAFLGAETINAVNASGTSKYFFPFVSYGAFQKDAVSCDDVGCEYTSKFAIDEYSKFWLETFYPSLNTLEVIKLAFEQKGYRVDGTAYHDPIMTNIYQSVNLADEQKPEYALWQPQFGVINAQFTFSNINKEDRKWAQDLTYPYLKVEPTPNQGASTKYNLETVDIWNMLDSGCTSNFNMNSPSYIYEPDEQIFVVPHTGWWKIKVVADLTIASAGTTFNSYGYYNDGDCDSTIPKSNMTFTRDIDEDCPIEVQLVRNYDGNAELIKGKWNVKYRSGNKAESDFYQHGCGYTSNTVPNKVEWITEFPHQDLYSAEAPTDTSKILSTSVSQIGGRSGRNVASAEYGSITEEAPASVRGRIRPRPLTANTIGYVTHSGNTMPYDQAVSEAFICGFSSWKASKQPSGNTYIGNVAVQKNGYSWSKTNTIKNELFANVGGMDYIDAVSGVSATTYCENIWSGAPDNYAEVYAHNGSLDELNGQVECCVWLERNDVLELLLLQRNYEYGRNTEQQYGVSGNCRLEIRAIDDKSYENMKASNYTYNTLCRYGANLNMTQYMNEEEKVSDWIESVLTAFNLQLTQNGNDIMIDTNRGLKKTITNAIDIDDRVSENDCETSLIDYPRSMSVQYKIDTEEWGFETTVPPEHIDDKDWYEWGDSGYSVVRMSNDSYNTADNTTTTQFSYTYYDTFTSGNTEINIPVIEKAEYMADGYGYEEAMKHDGYGLTQRFWFRQTPSTDWVKLSSYKKPLVGQDPYEKIYLSYPINVFNGVNLSYKDTEKSLLTEYFNFVPLLSSNFVKVELYLTPTEYQQIKCGAKVKFCTDIYWVSEISGFDPSGNNKTTLKLIKQV